MNKLLSIVGVLLLVTAFANAACGTLSTPDTVLTLTGNETIAGADCFDITADNVTIDCAGYSIIGDDTASTSGIYTTNNATTIKNCNIQGFFYGIHGTTSPFLKVSDSNITALMANGRALQTFGGSANSIISNVKAQGDDYGILLGGTSPNSRIENCYGNGSHVFGLSINGENSTITHSIGESLNDISYNDEAIRVLGNNGIIEYSTAIGGIHGLVLQNGNNMTLQNSATIGSRQACEEFIVTSSTTKNNICNATLYGMDFGGAIDSLIINNTIFATIQEVNLNDFGGNSNLTFYWNTFLPTEGYYVVDTSGLNHYSATEGNIWPEIFNGIVYRESTTPSIGFPQYGVSSQQFNNNMTLNITGTVIDYAPLTPNLLTTDFTIFGFNYTRTITVNSGVTSTLTDFPVRIPIDTATLVIEGKLKPTCGDMRIYDGNDLLPYEIENCNNANTILYTKISSLASGDKNLTLYYGNTSIGGNETPSLVWTNGFYLVNHMNNEQGDLMKSSAGPDFVCDYNNSVLSQSQYGQGLNFTDEGGTYDPLDQNTMYSQGCFVNDSTFLANFTFTSSTWAAIGFYSPSPLNPPYWNCWFGTCTIQGRGTVYWNGANPDTRAMWAQEAPSQQYTNPYNAYEFGHGYAYNGQNASWENYSGDPVVSGGQSSIFDGKPTMFTFNINDTNALDYLNGTEVLSSDPAGVPAYDRTEMFGYSVYYGISAVPIMGASNIQHRVQGLFDEVRVSEPRTSDWILAEYGQQSALGNEQQNLGPTTTTTLPQGFNSGGIGETTTMLPQQQSTSDFIKVNAVPLVILAIFAIAAWQTQTRRQRKR